MITDDGRLVYSARPSARRTFAHRLRHAVNPVVGIGAGLVFGAALFVVAVQVLFAVRPSVVAIVLAVAAVVAYLVSVLRARRTAGALGAYSVEFGPDGVADGATGAARVRPWPTFGRWLEDEQDFVLVAGTWRDRTIVVLPKAGVPDEEQDLVREVLHSHIDPDDEPIEDAFVEMGWDEEPARPPRRAAD